MSGRGLLIWQSLWFKLNQTKLPPKRLVNVRCGFTGTPTKETRAKLWNPLRIGNTVKMRPPCAEKPAARPFSNPETIAGEAAIWPEKGRANESPKVRIVSREETGVHHRSLYGVVSHERIVGQRGSSASAAGEP